MTTKLQEISINRKLLQAIALKIIIFLIDKLLNICRENPLYPFNVSSLCNFPIRRNGEAKQMNVVEYVSIISDILRMKKNLCLCRHFHRLDKHFITK